MPNPMLERIKVVEGDIAALDIDAIVNAANESLAPGAGVCGAIHRASGPELAAACARIGHCPTGQARLTPGFKLKARYVIHTVGPIWRGGDLGEEELLATCYRDSLRLAAESGIKRIAFPAISTGVYGYPLERASRVAIATVRQELVRRPAIEQVVFCCFGAEPAALYRRLLAT
jgi:O-acetyl-ADP-ribose deacetylase (regulator of RNase III)